MPKKRTHGPRSFEARLEHILRHAAKVFAEKGYEGASIRDISRSSGVSLGGIYYYGESKQKLLYLIQKYNFTILLARLEKRLRSSSNPVERLRILISNHVDFFLRHPVEMKVLSHEDDAVVDPFRREVAEIKRRYYQLARQVFDDLRKSSRVRRITPRLAVLSLFGMMNWIYKWHNPKIDPPAERLAEAIAGIFLEGVMVAGGKPRAHGRRSSRRSLSNPGALPDVVARLVQ